MAMPHCGNVMQCVQGICTLESSSLMIVFTPIKLMTANLIIAHVKIEN